MTTHWREEENFMRKRDRNLRKFDLAFHSLGGIGKTSSRTEKMPHRLPKQLNSTIVKPIVKPVIVCYYYGMQSYCLLVSFN